MSGKMQTRIGLILVYILKIEERQENSFELGQGANKGFC